MSNELDDLLDSTLDDLADLPSFTPFHPGAHTCTVTMEAKKVTERSAVEMTFTHVESAELAADQLDQDGNPRVPPVPGDTCNSLFFMDTEFGQGKFKETAAIFAEALDIQGTLRDIIEGVTDVQVMLINGIRIAKDKREYLDVKELGVV